MKTRTKIIILIIGIPIGLFVIVFSGASLMSLTNTGFYYTPTEKELPTQTMIELSNELQVTQTFREKYPDSKPIVDRASSFGVHYQAYPSNDDPKDPNFIRNEADSYVALVIPFTDDKIIGNPYIYCVPNYLRTDRVYEQDYDVFYKVQSHEDIIDYLENENCFLTKDDSAQISFESQIRGEYYEIQITGMKDIYRIGEQYDFSYIISGYGYSCGSKKITFPDQNGNTMKTISSSSCIAGVPMKEFVIDSQKQYDTTSVHGTIKIPGIYNVTITFDRPSQDFPTTAIKEFRVPPINSWYNNQTSDADLQTVIDSCANDSPKERMLNGLIYSNGTHVFSNRGCEWQTIGVYVGENEN